MASFKGAFLAIAAAISVSIIPVSGEAVLSSGALVDKLYTGLDFGRRTIVVFPPAKDYLRSLSINNHRDIRELLKSVHDLLKSLASLLHYQRLMSTSMDESEEATAIKIVLQAIVDDGCTWLKSILGNFNCTESDLKALMSHVEIYRSMIKSANAFRRVCNHYSGSCTEQPYVQWVRENIPCEGDGITAREVISSPDTKIFCDRPLAPENCEFSVLRCPSNATDAPAIAH